MFLVSTGRSTILSTFPELESESEYPHANTEKTDFQFFCRKRAFVEVNEKTGLDFLRIKESTPQKLCISRIRKIKLDNLICIACPKHESEDIAVGLSNGQVKLLNFKSAVFTHKFPAENPKNSVICLDYNASDEYISSVHENGIINVYGTKTKAKLQTINSINNSILSRFHPSKRFHLSIATYKGSVFIYDIQSKKKVFSCQNCHAAPCKDLCMSLAIPHCLISVGYDCKINVFDTRDKAQSAQIPYRSPLSAAALSECGNLFCVGDLKGQLACYDMRNTKTCLGIKKVHEHAVTRISFLPPDNESCLTSILSENQTVIDTPATARRPTQIPDQTSKARRDSFCDFLEFHKQTNDKVIGRYTASRDSFDWNTFNKKTNIEEKSAHNYRRSTKLMESATISQILQISSSDKENLPTPLEVETVVIDDEPSRTDVLRERNSTSGKLNKIREEEELADVASPDIAAPKIVLPSTPNLQIDGREFFKLPDDRNSTPNPLKKGSSAQNLHDVDVLQELQNLRSEMNERFLHLASELHFSAECSEWNLITHHWNLWRKHMHSTEQIKTSVALLLQQDPFVNEYMQLKSENELLKKKLAKLGEHM